MHFTKTVSTLCFLLFWLLCLQMGAALAEPGHTVRGVVITTDGAVVAEFTVVVRHSAHKPELVQRLHFKNREFKIDGLTSDKYQLGISSSSYSDARPDFAFKSHSRPTDYSVVILHNYRR